jgi:imidazolonepropionase-like amidohydrolase
MIRLATLLFALFTVTTTCYGQETILIRDVGCIDLEKGTFRTRDVFISDGTIQEVRSKYRGKTAERTIDGGGKYLVPGLVDAHIHLFQSGGIYTRPDAIDLREFKPYSEELEWVKENAQNQLERYLKAGVTSVIDMGGPMGNYGIRDSLPREAAVAELWLTGPLVSTYVPEALQIADPPIVKVADAEAARELVRKQLPYNPDFIKIWYIVAGADGPEANFDLVQATIEESHLNHLPVAVHATQLETAKLAVKAGADILVHSVDDPVDQAFIDLLLDKEVVYIPTLVVSTHYLDAFGLDYPFTPLDFKFAHPEPLGSLMDARHFPQGHPLDGIQSSMEQLRKRAQFRDSVRADNLKRLSDAGVRIATGTDAGNIGTLHASSYFKELEWMEKAGMSRLEILRASTSNGAKVLGKQEQLGSVAPGKEADLLLLTMNPLEDLRALQYPEFILADGRLYTPDSLLLPGPETLVQQQLNAYNARDLDAFLEPYSDDVVLYRYPDQLSSEGKAALRPVYQRLFEQVPELHCQLVNRMVLGNKVIDYERVSGFPDGRVIEAIAQYEIKGGKIIRVTFLYPE